MIENKELGIKIAENPREVLIEETIENLKKSIIGDELNLELKRQGLNYLETLIIRQTE